MRCLPYPGCEDKQRDSWETGSLSGDLGRLEVKFEIVINNSFCFCVEACIVKLVKRTYLVFQWLPRMPWILYDSRSNRCGRRLSWCFLSWWWDLAFWIHNISFQKNRQRLWHSHIDRRNGTLNRNSRMWAWSSALKGPPGSRSDKVR